MNITFQNVMHKTVQRWSKIGWARRTVLLLAVLAFLSLGVFGLYYLQTYSWADASNGLVAGDTDTVGDANNDDAIPGTYVRRMIDGAYVEPAAADVYPLAVMIDNDPNARPQAGLAWANIVYEARAEAGITRFLALFASDKELEEIGPVRSARPYFVRWAEGYDALYAHVGGSPEALALLRRIGMPSLNEFYNGGYFWRSQQRFAPHNVYTNTDNLRAYREKLILKNDGYRAWLYRDEAVTKERPLQSEIAVNYSVDNFFVQWKYEADKNAYRRYMGGAVHDDADGTPIYAKNVLIMHMNSRVLDEEFRREMSSIGKGKAWYCLDGTCGEGEWRKPVAQEREVFYDLNGEELRLNGGTTWIQVINSFDELSIE